MHYENQKNMVDNFELISKSLSFQNEKSFYFIQILKRKKENPDQKSYSRPIESFYVFSIEDLEKYKPHIIEKCKEHRARAYIKMNCLDAESVMLEQIANITRAIREKNWHSMAKTLNSACGKCGKQEGNEKYYLVDIDENYVGREKEIERFIESSVLPSLTFDDNGFSYENNIPADKKVKLHVPTAHGMHLLTTGFNIQKFREKYPDIDVHDDGITLLYFPELND